MARRDTRNDALMRGFGERLRAARLSAGFADAADMADHLGIRHARYRTYERGEAMAPPDILELIVQTTGQTTDWLILGISPRQPRSGAAG